MTEEKVLRLITNPNLLKTQGKYNLHKLFKLIDYVNKHEHLYDVFYRCVCPGLRVYTLPKKFLSLVDEDLMKNHVGKLSEYEELEATIYYSIREYFSDLFYHKISKTDIQLDFIMNYLTNIERNLINLDNTHFVNFMLEYKTRLPDKVIDNKFDIITKDYADFVEKYSVEPIKNLYKTYKNYEKSYIQLYSFISAIDTSAVDLKKDDIVISHESVKKLLATIGIQDFMSQN